MREKLTQSLLTSSVPLDVVPQPDPSPQVTLLLAVPTTTTASHIPWAVQGPACLGIDFPKPGLLRGCLLPTAGFLCMEIHVGRKPTAAS